MVEVVGWRRKKDGKREVKSDLLDGGSTRVAIVWM